MEIWHKFLFDDLAIHDKSIKCNPQIHTTIMIQKLLHAYVSHDIEYKNYVMECTYTFVTHYNNKNTHMIITNTS